MSDEQQALPTDDPLRVGVGWVAKHWPRIRLGHEGMMLDKIDRQRQIVEQLAQNQMTGNYTNTELWPKADDGNGEDMGVKIGDEIHYHTTTTQPAAPQPATPVESTSSKLLPYLLAAALAGGSGLGGALLATQLAKPATTVIEQPVVQQPNIDTDTDTQYELRISSGK